MLEAALNQVLRKPNCRQVFILAIGHLITCWAVPWTYTYKGDLGHVRLGKEWEPPQNAETIDTIEVSNFNLSLYDEVYSNKKPFVMRGVVKKWPATKHWVLPKLMSIAEGSRYENAESIKDNSEGIWFPPTYTNRQKKHWTNAFFGSISTYGKKGDDSDIQGEPWATDCPYRVMSGQKPDKTGLFGTNYMPTILKELERLRVSKDPYKHVFLLASATGAGATVHCDPWRTGFWNAQVHGRKRWMFISASELEKISGAVVNHTHLAPLVGKLSGRKGPPKNRKEAKTHLHNITAGRWFGKLLPALTKAGINYSATDFVAEPGDMIYGPGGSSLTARRYHIVLAMSDSIGCSEQLVDKDNLITVLQGLVMDYRTTKICRAFKHWPDLNRTLWENCTSMASHRRRRGGGQDLASMYKDYTMETSQDDAQEL